MAKIWLLCFLMSIWTLQTEANVSLPCSASNSSNCTSPLEECSSSHNVCLCTQDYFEDPSTHVCTSMNSLKVSNIYSSSTATTSVTVRWTADTHGTNVTYIVQASPGGRSVSGVTGTSGTVSGLTAGTQYSFTVTSVLPAGGYYQQKTVSESYSSSVWTRIAYNDDCDPNNPSSNICYESYTGCIESVTGNRRCLCTANYYISPETSTCRSLSELRVLSLTASNRLTTSVELSWSADKHGTSVRYTVQSSPGGRTVSGITGNSTTVSGLTAGTQYSFTVTSVLPADSYYQEKSYQTSISRVWTFPNTPGSVTKAEFVNWQTDVYDITFGSSSSGSVSYYTVTINGIEVRSTGSSPQVRFTNLTPATTYSYTIYAHNGIGEKSSARSSSFTTPPEPAGNVSSVSVTSVTFQGAQVNWRKPAEPNGNITGYSVFINEGSTCVYGHVITCSDCSTSGQDNTSQCNEKSSESKTSSVLNGTSTISVSVTGLKPYHDYNAIITARNTDGSGIPFQIGFRTAVGVPETVKSVRVTSSRDVAKKWINLDVTWTPGEFTGPTDYIVVVQEETSFNSGSYKPLPSQIVSGHSTTRVTITNVLAYWRYIVNVTARTTIGSSGIYTSQPIQTESSVPGVVKNIVIKQDEVIAEAVTMTITCPNEKDRNGTIKAFRIRKSVNLVVDEYPIALPENSSSCGITVSESDVEGILVEQSYSFAVKVINENNVEGSYKTVNFAVLPRVPRLSSEDLVSDHNVSALVMPATEVMSYDTAIDVVLCASCLLDARQGTVQNIGLIVCLQGDDDNDNCNNNSSDRMKRSVTMFQDFPTWSEAKKDNFLSAYRTTPDGWLHSIASADQISDLPFTVGYDSICDRLPSTLYCNGPLPPNSKIRIAALKCNQAGCDLGTYSDILAPKTQDEDDDLALIITIAVAAAVIVTLAIIIIVLVVLYRRKGVEQDKKRQMNNYSALALDGPGSERHNYEAMAMSGNASTTTTAAALPVNASTESSGVYGNIPREDNGAHGHRGVYTVSGDDEYMSENHYGNIQNAHLVLGQGSSSQSPGHADYVLDESLGQSTTYANMQRLPGRTDEEKTYANM